MPVVASSTTTSNHYPRPSGRTNSLGWAQSDCHTCSALGRRCNRRRPRCDSCTAQDVICGGYVQRLDWQRGVASRGKLQGVKLTVDRHCLIDRSFPKPVALTFLQETGLQPKPKPRRRKQKVAETQKREISHEEEAPPLDVVRLDERKQSPHKTQLGDTDQKIKLVLCQSLPNLYQLHPDMLDLLSFYEWRFSVSTLTFDVKVNPWQSCLPMIFETPCLMDAVTAVAKRHRAHCEHRPEGLEVMELKDRALSSLGTCMEAAPCEAIISTSLALIGLEYADTGFSPWTIHLVGAYQVLEARGGIGLAEQNSTLRSQVAMLAWYDLTAALLSRRGPIFPRCYIEALMRWRLDTEWSLLSLNGCPDSLFLVMYDIASAAAHPDLLTADQAAMFEVQLWNAGLDVPVAQEDKFLAGLLDCWRSGLLLYCARIFRSHDKEEAEATKTLAAEIICLVADLPADSAMQKQCLLPLVLAGCETGREQRGSRFIVSDFCTRWKETTGLWVFASALELLHQVWKRMDSENEWHDVWWGDVVSPESLQGYLFG